MNAREFLVLAKGLANENTEAAWRTAASRAYYATFHVASELLEGLGFRVPPDESAHAYLWYRLGNCGHPSTQRAGADFKVLRKDRTRADYELGRFVAQAKVKGQVQAAEQIIQALDAAAVEPVRTQITDAMKQYERDVLRAVTWRP